MIAFGEEHCSKFGTPVHRRSRGTHQLCPTEVIFWYNLDNECLEEVQSLATPRLKIFVQGCFGMVKIRYDMESSYG